MECERHIEQRSRTAGPLPMAILLVWYPLSYKYAPILTQLQVS